MAAYNLTAEPQFVGTAAPWGTTGNGWGQFYVQKLHCDIDKMNESTLALAAITDGDVVSIWDIPLGTYIQAVFVDFITAATAPTCTVSVSAGAAEAEWMAATTLTADKVAGTLISDARGLTGGALYTSATTLDLYVHVAAAAGAVFDVYVICCSVKY
jgi:hypothetical protein